jgi:putative FmdB family regulatory protein
VPTYQYVCTACGDPLEAVQSFTDAPLTVCPACGGALRKVFSAVGVVFKGSGFYKNDSRKGRSDSGDSKPDTTKTDTPTKVDTAPKADGSPKRDRGKSGDSTPPSTPSTSSTPGTSSTPAAKSA